MKAIIKYFFLILFLLTGNVALQAQQSGQIRILPKTLEQNGEKFNIEMTFEMSNLSIQKTESRIYTPILVSVKHKREIELPMVIIKGSRRYKADHREEVLSGHPIFTSENHTSDRNSNIYAIEKFDRKNRIPYHTSIAWKDWMAEASLNLREDVYGCCGKLLRTIMHRDILQDVDTQYEMHPKFCYITPEKEQEKKRYEIGKAYLDFPQGKSIIDPLFRNNRQELDKINQMIVMLASDPDVSIQNIEMRGYASPESSQSFNYNLSSQRAQAMRDYFAHLTTLIPAKLYQIGSGGEDWEGLKNLLTNYPISNLDEILNIINTVQDLDTREQMIKNIGGGKPYQFIYSDLYPQLRRVDCQINYIARNFTIDEGKERILNKPKMLSQNEMYQIARTYPEGSEDFNRTIVNAQKHFPDNDAANINAAVVSLSDKDVELAEAYLSQVKNTKSPEYANCMGVLLTLKGDYNVAEVYLKRAQEAGIAEATHNLQELQNLQTKKSDKYPIQKDSQSPAGRNPNPSNQKRITIDGEVYIKENE